ncbi:MAG: transposase [Candidatus Dormibacteria bacterium]
MLASPTASELLPFQRRFLAKTRAFTDELDEAIRGQRGRPLVPIRVLFGGLLLVAGNRRRLTITEVEIFFHHANRDEMAAVWDPDGVIDVSGSHSLWPRPSRWQMYRILAALKRGVRASRGDAEGGLSSLESLLQAKGSEEVLTEFANRLIDESFPRDEAGEEWAVDTTFLDAACKKISQAAILEGQRASDPDARWRVIEQNGKVARSYFGHGIEAYCQTGPREYIGSLAVQSADQDDKPPSLRLLKRMLDQGIPVKRLAMDRGFSQAPVFLEEVRSLGCAPVFDLKKGQAGRSASWRGCVILDGWPFVPSVPKRLWDLPKPDLRASRELKQKWRADMDERLKYMLLPNGGETPSEIRVQSPLFRNRRLGCPLVPGSMRNRDKSLAVCSGEHREDEGCCLRNGTWKAEFAPWTFQYPVYGSPVWVKQFAKRSAIERKFSQMKNPNVIGLRPGSFRLRGLTSMTLLATMAAVAHNIRLEARAVPVGRGSPPEQLLAAA